MEVTVTIDNEQFIQVPFEETSTIEHIKRLVEFQTNILIADQIIMFEGKELEESKKVSEYNIKNGDMIFVTKRKRIPQQSNQQQQQYQQQMQRGQPQQQQRGFPFKTAREFINYMKEHPEELSGILNQNAQLANAILSEDEGLVQQFIEAIEKQRRLAELAADPFNEEGQRAIYEHIQQQNIEHNMEHAMEHTPEAFGRVIMLYVDCSINNIPIKAFVDTGAQQSIMTVKCAERCGLMRLVDKRFHGVAKGVGTAKIVGRIHATSLKLGKGHFTIALSVLDSPGQDTEFILGLDMLKRHQCNVNLKTETLEIGDEHVPFLAEKDLTEILRKEDPLPENYVPPTTNSPSPATTAAPKPTTPTNSNSFSSANNTPTTNTTQTTSPNPINRPAVASNPTSSLSSPPSNTFPQESIDVLIQLGASRQKAIDLLTRARGNVDAAASLFFGL